MSTANSDKIYLFYKLLSTIFSKSFDNIEKSLTIMIDNANIHALNSLGGNRERLDLQAKFKELYRPEVAQVEKYIWDDKIEITNSWRKDDDRL